MGYFSQRKKQARENLFMVISLLLIAIVYCILLFDTQTSSFINELRSWQFHLYLFNILFLLYTLWHRKFFYTFLAAFLLILNYGSIAKTSRLFFSDTSDRFRSFNVTYQKGLQNYPVIQNPEEVLVHRSGKLELSPQISASFISFEKYDQVITLVNVDFSKIEPAEQKLVFNNLAEFVANQDEPVVVFGDFGIPSWSPIFRDFLINTDLDVKNRILFSDGEQYFRLFTVPTINVLGFKNIGIRRLKFLPESKSFDIKLAF